MSLQLLDFVLIQPRTSFVKLNLLKSKTDIGDFDEVMESLMMSTDGANCTHTAQKRKQKKNEKTRKNSWCEYSFGAEPTFQGRPNRFQSVLVTFASVIPGGLLLPIHLALRLIVALPMTDGRRGRSTDF